MARVSKRYKIAVCVKLGKDDRYRVDVDTTDQEGAMLLARLLKEHDADIMLTEYTDTSDFIRIKVKKWPKRKRRKVYGCR